MSVYRTTRGELRAGSLAFEIATFIIGASIFGYTCLRAYSLSFTHDESVTCLNFASSTIEDILTFNGPSPSNNHLLNSLLVKASASLFDPKEFFLRLPNLIAHILYLCASFLILQRLKSPLIGLGGFVILNSNPFLLDFFSIARGLWFSLRLPDVEHLLPSPEHRGSCGEPQACLFIIAFRSFGCDEQFFVSECFFSRSQPYYSRRTSPRCDGSGKTQNRLAKKPALSRQRIWFY